MKNKYLITFLVFPFILFLFFGCGYSYKAVLPEHIKRIYIPIFKNDTLQYNIEGVLTDTIVKQFVSQAKLIEGGYLTVVQNKSEADAELDGEIVQYILEPVLVDQKGSVQEYKMRLLLNLNFLDLINNNSLWSEQNYECKTKIFWKVAPTIGVPQTEQEVQLQVYQELAQEIVNRTIFGW